MRGGRGIIMSSYDLSFLSVKPAPKLAPKLAALSSLSSTSSPPITKQDQDEQALYSSTLPKKATSDLVTASFLVKRASCRRVCGGQKEGRGCGSLKFHRDA